MTAAMLRSVGDGWPYLLLALTVAVAMLAWGGWLVTAARRVDRRPARHRRRR